MDLINYLYLPAMLLALSWVSLYLLPAVREFSERVQTREADRRNRAQLAVERTRLRPKPGIICSFPLREVVREEMRLY